MTMQEGERAAYSPSGGTASSYPPTHPPTHSPQRLNGFISFQ